MEKINIAGYEFNNFGSNNYSNGMELITSIDRPSEILQKVKYQEPGFENIWLNPSTPCSTSEFFGFFGANNVKTTFASAIKDAITSLFNTEEKHSASIKALPFSPSLIPKPSKINKIIFFINFSCKHFNTYYKIKKEKNLND